MPVLAPLERTVQDGFDCLHLASNLLTKASMSTAASALFAPPLRACRSRQSGAAIQSRDNEALVAAALARLVGFKCGDLSRVVK